MQESERAKMLLQGQRITFQPFEAYLSGNPIREPKKQQLNPKLQVNPASQARTEMLSISLSFISNAHYMIKVNKYNSYSHPGRIFEELGRQDGLCFCQLSTPSLQQAASVW